MNPSTKTRAGRRRWSKLVRFLTTTMETSGSEKVRMSAAERLTEILLIREKRELAELQAQARVSNTADAKPDEVPSDDLRASAPETDTDASPIFASILNGRTNELTSCE